ncbi:EPS depolymerase [Erwinia phage VyarbaL]|nr:EPS depolymerase [Erwinia phage VyarbaL]
MPETKIKPWNTEIWTDSIETLRQMNPVVPGHTVDVAGYYYGSKKGGGKFVYDPTDTATADDGGFTIVTTSGKRFKRADPIDTLDITHFGAYCNGLADDMFAVVRMHNWSRSIDLTFGPGIVLPSGVTCLSPYDFGSTEIPSFKLRGGAPIAYGRTPASKIVPFNMADTGYIFRYKARRMSVSGIVIIGTGGSGGFMENTVTRGDYCMIERVQARDLAKRAFHVFDTIDCTVRQCYSSSGGGSFFRTDWSNESPGAWDHPTAIKISECNFEGHTGEYAISCIRAGQSVMEDTWFDKNNQGFDISQGGWVLKNVTQENSKLPSGAQYSKLSVIQCRFAQGAGLDRDTSGYDPSQDPSGSKPSWVDSVYERGWMQMNNLGFIQYGGSFSTGYESSQYKLENMTGGNQWAEIGTLGLSGATAKSVIIELNGTGQFDTATSDPQPNSTNFGAGRAFIFVQQKDQSEGSKMPVSWYGEQASPIGEVRVDNSNKNRPRIFVKMRNYVGGIAVTFKTNDKSNFEGGQHFYLSTVMANVTAAVAEAFPVAPSNWGVSDGNYGLGFNMSTGLISISSTSPEIEHASQYLPVMYNGVKKYLAMQDDKGSVRMPRYTKAELLALSPNVHVYGLVMCTDSGAGSGAGTQAQLCYSDGSRWVRAMDNSTLS